MQQHTLEHTLGCTVARSCDAMQLLAKQGTLCGDGLLLEENEDNSINATLISYNKHNRLIARSWCSFISSLSQEMSVRFLEPMMHSEEVVRPYGVFATVDPVACQQPRHLWLVTRLLVITIKNHANLPTAAKVAAWSMVESAPLLQPTALPLPPCRSHRRG